MVLDEFHGLSVINLTRCINTLVNFKFIFLKKDEEEKTSQLELEAFLWNTLCRSYSERWLSVRPSSVVSPFLFPLIEKQSCLFTEMSSQIQKPPTSKPPAQIKLTPSSIIMQSLLPQKRTLKRSCFLKSLRASQVYRLGQWSQVSFKHQTDHKPQTFPKQNFSTIYIFYSQKKVIMKYMFNHCLD